MILVGVPCAPKFAEIHDGTEVESIGFFLSSQWGSFGIFGFSGDCIMKLVVFRPEGAQGQPFEGAAICSFCPFFPVLHVATQ